MLLIRCIEEPPYGVRLATIMTPHLGFHDEKFATCSLDYVVS